MRILYATDGSKQALAAAALLTELPLGPDCRLTVLTVAPRGEEEAAERTLAAAREALQPSAARVETAVRNGNPAEEILTAAEEQPTDLLVMGASGVSAIARFFTGTVTERVVQHARCPVLVVRPGPERWREVLIGVDGSEGGARAAEWVRSFPLPPDSQVRLVTLIPNLHAIARERLTVMPPLVEGNKTLDELEREEAQLRLDTLCEAFVASGKKAVTEIRSADPATGLLDAATDEGAGILVVGSHGRSAVQRFLLGSVSQNVLRHAPCSVLVVK
jgi:nucleotide-binding universal stress UspA family protein